MGSRGAGVQAVVVTHGETLERALAPPPSYFFWMPSFRLS
jgi:hypothetical protein